MVEVSYSEASNEYLGICLWRIWGREKASCLGQHVELSSCCSPCYKLTLFNGCRDYPILLVYTFISFLYNNMCTYNTISTHTDHFQIQKRDSEESLLTFVNMFPSIAILL